MSGRGKKIDWDDVGDLGKNYDSAIAKRLGVTVKEVFKARKSRKILPFSPNRRTRKVIDWAAQPLGEETDVAIAKRLGVSSTAVAYHRHARDKPPAGGPRGPSSKTINIDWDALPLGQESDRAIGKRLGISYATVGIKRRERGIASFRSRTTNNIDWEQVEDLGTSPASVIAERLGVDASAVYHHRKRLGVCNPAVNKEERYRRSAQTIRETYTKQNESSAAAITNRLTDEMGVTLWQLCEHLDLSASLVSAFRTGKMSPVGPSGFRTTARRLASVYGLAPEQIWSEYDPLSQVDIGTDGLDEMFSPWPNPEELIGQTSFADFLPDLLESVLTPRERAIITDRFAAVPKTLQEIGDEFLVSRERIRQIQYNAMQKLRRAYGLKTTLKDDDDNPSAGNVPPRGLKPGPKPKAKSKRLSKQAPNKRTGRTCKELVLDFFRRHPDSSFSAHQVVEKLKGSQYSNGTVTNAIYSLRDSENIHQTSLARYSFAKATLTFRAKKVHNKGEKTGGGYILALLDASPRKAFTFKEVESHLISLGYTTATARLYLNRLNKSDQIQLVSRGHYQSILTEPITNDKIKG